MVKVFVYATLESIWIIVLAFTGSRLVYILNILFLYLHIYLYRFLPSIRVKKCLLKCLFCLTKCLANTLRFRNYVFFWLFIFMQ